MVARGFFASLFVLAAMLALVGVHAKHTDKFCDKCIAQTAPFYGCGICATTAPTNVPTIIPGAYLVQVPASAEPDPGATPDNYLFRAIDFNSEPTSTIGCGQFVGPANCQIYKYTDFAVNACNTAAERTVWAWQNANDEASFLHAFGGTISAANRYPNPNNSGGIYCPNGAGQGGNTNNGGMWNPNDSSLATEVNVQLANTGANYWPSPFNNVFEDTPFMMGQNVCGSTGQPTSAEYGSTLNATGTTACNLPGTGPLTVGVDYDTAIGKFVSRMSKPIWLNDGFPCCSANEPGSCNVINGVHCHDALVPNFIDDAFAYHNVCANAGGNLKGILYENALMHKYNGTTWPLASGLTMVGYINSVANFQNDSACNGAFIADFEYMYGQGGPGDLAGSTAVRTLITAMIQLVPDPATSIPDRVVFEYLGITCNSTVSQNPSATQPLVGNNPCVTGEQETGYGFEQTIVPVGAEQTVGTFTWNGTTVSIGGGCDGTTDSGGAVSLEVQCVGTQPILCQQYKNSFQNALSYGPYAVCVNTSTSSEPILSSWFKHDPITTYAHTMAISGGELTSVPWTGLPGNVVALQCNYLTNCTGLSSVASNQAAFNPASPGNLCGQCGIEFWK